MKIKSQKDFWSGLMFIAVGLAFAWGANNYRMGSSANPGPGYFPLGLGVLLALLGAAVVFKSVTARSLEGERTGDGVSWRALVLVVGSVVLFGVALPWLGLVIALPLLVLVASLAGDEFRWHEVALNAAVLTVGAWLIFVKGLGLTLPMWPAFLGG